MQLKQQRLSYTHHHHHFTHTMFKVSASGFYAHVQSVATNATGFSNLLVV